MANDPDDAVDIDVVILEETEIDVLVDYGGSTTRLPKFLIELDPTRSDGDYTTSIILPRWLAEKKNML